MDYSHTNNKLTSEQDFFTAGPGTNSMDVNNVEPENNLDLSNSMTAWTESTGHNPRNIGGSAIINSSEVATSPNADTSTPDISNQELGQIIPADTIAVQEEPVGRAPNTLESSAMETQSVTEDIEEIKTTEHLNSAGVIKVENIVNDLRTTGDAAEFYKKARDIMEENLKKSYDRVLGKTS